MDWIWRERSLIQNCCELQAENLLQNWPYCQNRLLWNNLLVPWQQKRSFRNCTPYAPFCLTCLRALCALPGCLITAPCPPYICVSYVRAFRALIVRLHIFLVWICNRPKTIFQGLLKTLQIVLLLFVWVERPTSSFLRRWNFLNIFKKLNHFNVLVFVLSFQPWCNAWFLWHLYFNRLFLKYQRSLWR